MSYQQLLFDVDVDDGVALIVTKKFLWEGMSSSVPEMMKRESPAFAWFGNQPDAREGVQSFVEKRPPKWSLTPSDVPESLIE